MYCKNWKLEAETTRNMLKSSKTENQYAATIKVVIVGDGLDNAASNQRMNAQPNMPFSIIKGVLIYG